jgi:hypothetical protein
VSLIQQNLLLPVRLPLNDEELKIKREELADLAMEINELEEKKKLLMEELKFEMSGPKELYAKTLTSIRYRQDQRSGKQFMIDDQENKIMYIFDEDAVCIGTRSLKPEERQRVLKMETKTGTDE